MHTPNRCPWAVDEAETAYHDTEWGVPLHEDRKLFEMLILEGMQAGLSWRLVLHKREAMRAAFDGFDPEVIANYDDTKLESLMQDPGIIRNRRKIWALRDNARAFLRVRQAYGSFDAYLWAFTGGETLRGGWARPEEVPATSPVSDAMSKDLKQRGFKFVGSTICYSLMQAVGMVNDHLASCDFA